MMSQELEGIFDPDSLIVKSQELKSVVLKWNGTSFKCVIISCTRKKVDLDIKFGLLETLFFDDFVVSAPTTVVLSVGSREMIIDPQKITKVTFKPMSIRLKFRE